MNINFEESPWFHVHFTLPNQTTKRRLVKVQDEQRRIKNVIQEKNSFLAAKSKKTHGKTNFDHKFDIQKQRQKEETYLDEAGKRTDVYQNNLFIESPREAVFVEKKVTLPPLKGISSVSCQGQQDPVTKSYKTESQQEKTTENSLQTLGKNKTMSIATCYDLYEWKPLSSVSYNPSRPLVSILKQNRDDRHKGQTFDNSDTSGYETDNEKASKSSKKEVRFAKGTVFRSSKGRRARLTYNKQNNIDEDDLNGLNELSFSDFIQRKRCERSKVSSTNCKSTNSLKFLKEKNFKRNQTKQKFKNEVILPTIIN